MNDATRQALEQLEQGLRADIRAAAAATGRLVTESDERTRGQFADVRGSIAALDGRMQAEFADVRGLVARSSEETRRHFDVGGEALRADIRSLAEAVVGFAESSIRRDSELGERIDRLEHRVLGLESRVSVLERPRRRRR